MIDEKVQDAVDAVQAILDDLNVAMNLATDHGALVVLRVQHGRERLVAEYRDADMGRPIEPRRFSLDERVRESARLIASELGIEDVERVLEAERKALGMPPAPFPAGRG